ncbi:MAG TPA: hypothetical protein VL738_31160 [Dactylosporangium sp.]|nr:hypothetical protein [Dactylosporangium sp.]
MPYAHADLDGLRVDTVKHMDPGAARYLASAIHEFAQSIGKERFFLIAEITGDRAFAYRTLDEVGMDAALGLADVQDRLERVKGGEGGNDRYIREAMFGGEFGPFRSRGGHAFVPPAGVVIYE